MSTRIVTRNAITALTVLGTLAPLLDARAPHAPPLAPLAALTEDEDDLPPPEPPPELGKVDAAKLVRELKKLRNSNDEARAKTEAKIIALGRGAIPSLVEGAHTDHEGNQAGILACLDALATLDDRELVASSLESEHVTLRRFAAREAGDLALPSLIEALPARLEDEDEQVRQEAALSLVRNGEERGLSTLVPYVGGDLDERLMAALPSIADAGSHAQLVEMLEVDKERERREAEAYATERLNVVRMLRAIGDRAARRALVTALDDPHNLVQREAINALRAIVEDKGPFEGSSIFQQIKEVDRLKALVD